MWKTIPISTNAKNNFFQKTERKGNGNDANGPTGKFRTRRTDPGIKKIIQHAVRVQIFKNVQRNDSFLRRLERE